MLVGQTKRIRLAIINSHPIQNLAPLYRLLAQSKVVDLHVLFMSDLGMMPSYDPGFDRKIAFDSPLAVGFEHEFVRRNVTVPRGSVDGLSLQVAGRLRALRPDAIVVHGYAALDNWIAAAEAHRSGLPYLVRGDSTLEAMASGRRDGRSLRNVAAGAFLRRAGVCLAGGIGNHAFYRHFGVDEARIIFAPFSVDTDFFAAAGELGRRCRASQLARVGLDPRLPVVVFAGKLVPWKRPQDVVHACRLLNFAVNVVVIGDGPQRDELGQLVESRRCVRTLGFVNQQEIGRWYGIADAVVVPSEREPWGLIANEALAAGSIPILSNAVGCSTDFVSSGAALEYECGNTRALADTLIRVLHDSGLRRELKRNGVIASKAYGLAATVEGYERAALLVTKQLGTAQPEVGASSDCVNE